MTHTCDRRSFTLGVVLSCMLMAFVACSGAQAVRTPSQICSLSADTPTGRVAQCALGCDAANPNPVVPTQSAVMWYTLDSKLDLDKRRGRVCVDGASMLPSPDRKGTYVVRDGALYVIRPGATEAAPLDVEIGQGGWRFSRLFGFRRWVSGVPILLVEMVREDEPGRYQLWSVRLLDRSGIAAPVRDEEMPTSPQAFFGDFDTPRCASGHEQCLVVAASATGERTLGIADRRGQSINVKALPNPKWQLRDASWVPGRPGEVVLLVDQVCKP